MSEIIVHLFCFTAVLFEMFKPFLGEKCIQYANGSDGRARRHLYDQVLTHDAIKKYFLQFQEVLTWGSTDCVFSSPKPKFGSR